MLKRRLLAAAAVLSVGFVAGCAQGQYAYGVQPADLVGAWRSANGPSIELSLEPDGSFSSRSWPARLTCLDGDTRHVDGLGNVPTSSVSGSWHVDPGAQPGWLPTVTFEVAGAECPSGPPLAYIWRDERGRLGVCLLLDPALDADNFVLSGTLVFTSDGDDRSADAACFG